MLKCSFTLEHIRNGEVLDTYKFFNGIVDEGMNYLLDTGFRGSTQETAWYIGLVDNSSFSAFANSDTMSSHTGWIEFTGYTEATRPAWSPEAAASRTITNATTVDYTVSLAGTLKGIFITSNSTKSGTGGSLWSTAAFANTITVSSGDTFKVTYSITG